MEVWEVREYKNFDDLIQHNKSLFKRILEDGHIDLMRACWSARDPEVHRLEKRVILKSKDLDSSQTLLAERDHTINKFNDDLNKLKNDLESKIKINLELEKSIKHSNKNIDSLEKFNKELLQSNADLQEDVNAYEKLNELKEKEFLEFSDKVERVKLESSIELKNAKEAIAYSVELEELQQTNLSYIQELETKTDHLNRDIDKLKKSYREVSDSNDLFATENKNLFEKIKNKEESLKNTNRQYQTALTQIKSLEKSLNALQEKYMSASNSGKQKQTNLKQMQSTLELKVRLLEERDQEVQMLSNKLNNNDDLLHELKEYILDLGESHNICMYYILNHTPDVCSILF